MRLLPALPVLEDYLLKNNLLYLCSRQVIYPLFGLTYPYEWFYYF